MLENTGDEVRNFDNAVMAIKAALNESPLIESVSTIAGDSSTLHVAGHPVGHPDITFTVELHIS